MTRSIADYYQRDVATISAESPVREAADAMSARAVGSLVVMEDGKPAGLVTDRDLLERVVAGEREAGATPTADVMSKPLRTASLEDSLDRVIDLMCTYGIRRVPVVQEGRLFGMIALDDIIGEVAEELGDLAEGARREFTAAQRKARARKLARDVGEQVRDLGGQLESAGAEAKEGLLRELGGLRERIRGTKR